MVKLYKDGDKIFNPETGRYVKVNGAIGRRLERMSDEQYNNLGTGAGAGAGVEEGGVKKFSADKKKILNPKSNKMVSVTGTTGRKLLKMSNDEYSAILRERERPAPKRQVKPVKPPVDLKKVIKEEQAKAIVRGVKKGDEYMRRFREETARLFNELPEVVIDEIIAVPPTHNIRDIARMLIKPPTLQREKTVEGPPPIPTLERERTVPEMVRTYTGETIPYVPRSRSSSLDTIPYVPRSRSSTLDTIDLEVISNVSENINALVQNLEDEFDVGVEESKIEDVIVDNIRDERMKQIEQMMKDYETDRQKFDNEDWKDFGDALNELEPVEDDKPEYKPLWESAMEAYKQTVKTLFGTGSGDERMKQLELMLNDYYTEGENFDQEDWKDFGIALEDIEPVEQDTDEYKVLWETAADIYKKNTKTSGSPTQDDELTRLLGYADEDDSEDERMKQIQEMVEDALTDGENFDQEEWQMFVTELYALEPKEDDKPEYKALWETAMDAYKKNKPEMKKADEQKFDTIYGLYSEDDLREMGLVPGATPRRDVMSDEEFLNILNSGRGAYVATSNVPDPHLSAFEHIQKHK